MRFTDKISALALSLITSALAFGAHAQSVDLRVTASIVPAACTPALSGGGIVDFGVIPASTLSKTYPTEVGSRTTSLTITCDAPAQVGFKVIDNRAASVAIGAGEKRFGLGTAGGAKIGAYTLTLDPTQFTVDGGQGFGLYSDTSQSSWQSINTVRDIQDSGMSIQEVYSVAKSDGSDAPDAFQTMTTAIEVTAVVARGDSLPLGERIEFDGSATIELTYL